MRGLIAVLLMFIAPLFFIWFPFPGLAGFIAGSIAGYLIRGPVRGALLAIVPFTVTASLVILIAVGFQVWLIGAVAGGVLFVVLLINNLALILGAVVGGTVYRVAGSRRIRQGLGAVRARSPRIKEAID